MKGGSGIGFFCSAKLGQSNTKPPAKRQAEQAVQMQKTGKSAITDVWTAIDP